MTFSDDLAFEMERMPLDTNTADRLLGGTVAPEDAPPGYARLCSVLAGTRSAGNAGPPESPRDTERIEVLVARARSAHDVTSKSPRRSTVHRIKLAAALATAALASTTGLALADGLPGAAQDVASSMLAKAGITVPGPNENAGTHPSVRGTSSPDVSDAAQQKPEADSSAPSGQGKGSEISQLATTTDATGVDKGAAISTLASGGTSQAGQHGEASAEHGSSGSQDGLATADQASGGHSTDGQSHRP